jgi:hypothetical protein
VLDTVRTGMENQFLRGTHHYTELLKKAVDVGMQRDAADKYIIGRMRDQAKSHGANAEFGRAHTAFEGVGKLPGGKDPSKGSTLGRLLTEDMPRPGMPKPFNRDPATGKWAPTWKDSKDFFDQKLMHLNNWNQVGTFGPRGEEGFATTLYWGLKDKYGLDPYAAAWAVREALGNYRNVSADSLGSKIMFFFPWLKTNTPFWFKTFLGHPTFINAPETATRRQREIARDPTAYDTQYSHDPMSLYMGKDDAGAAVHRTIPHPAKDALKAGEMFFKMLYPDKSGLAGAAQEGLGLVEGRMKPQFHTGADIVGTVGDPRPIEAGTFTGTHTSMWNRDTPMAEQGKDLLKSIALDMAPMVVPFVSREIFSQGFDPTSMGEYVQEALGMGYITHKTADNFQYLLGKNERDLHALMGKLNFAHAHPESGMSDQVYQFKAKRAFEIFKQRQEELKDNIMRLRKYKGEPQPPGVLIPKSTGDYSL